MNLQIKNHLSELDKAQDSLKSFLSAAGTEASEQQKCAILLDEVLSNIIRHGYRDNHLHFIDITLRINSDQISIIVRDDGVVFNPLLLDPPEIAQGLDQKSVGGLGVHIMKNLTSEIEYKRIGDRNHLHITVDRVT